MCITKLPTNLYHAVLPSETVCGEFVYEQSTSREGEEDEGYKMWRRRYYSNRGIALNGPNEIRLTGSIVALKHSFAPSLARLYTRNNIRVVHNTQNNVL